MLAAWVAGFDAANPLSALEVGHLPEPVDVPGGVRVRVRAATLNQHDVWTLRGRVALKRLPSVLGMDAAGVTEEGDEVIVHAVLGRADHGGGDETLDPSRTVLPDAGMGTLAEQIVVPRANLVAKPTALSWVEAACLPTSWLTAYRMLFTKGEAKPGETVLVQGAGGGVATAAVVLARAAGLRVVVTTRSAEKAPRAEALGAAKVLVGEAARAESADLVIETVGEATWRDSLSAARRGGRVVVSGATTGFVPRTNLGEVFSKQLSIRGTSMGTRAELELLAHFMDQARIRPVVDSVQPLSSVEAQFSRLLSGDAFGKVGVEV